MIANVIREHASQCSKEVTVFADHSWNISLGHERIWTRP